MTSAAASSGGTRPLVVVAIITTGTSRVYLHGDIDPSNHTQLVSALGGINLGAVHAVRLNLDAVTQCDRVGARHVLDFARTAQARGLSVLIEGAPPAIRLSADHPRRGHRSAQG